VKRPTRAINQIHGDIAKIGTCAPTIASLAAIKRSVMLKDFLKLVEYKIKR